MLAHAPSSPLNRPRALLVGAVEGAALQHAVAQFDATYALTHESWLTSARLRLEAGEPFETTLLLAARPEDVLSAAAKRLAEFSGAGELITIAGPWFEGRLRFQDKIGDRSIVYWHAVQNWLAERFPMAQQPAAAEVGQVVMVASRDRDAAAAIADVVASERATVIWCPRGGRQPFVSRADVGVWIGGQLDGPATVELARFCATFRQFGGRVIAMLDFPRADELATAQAVGAERVLCKPWNVDELLRVLQPPRLGSAIRLAA